MSRRSGEVLRESVGPASHRCWYRLANNYFKQHAGLFELQIYGISQTYNSLSGPATRYSIITGNNYYDHKPT